MSSTLTNSASVFALMDQMNAGAPTAKSGGEPVFDPEADTIRDEIQNSLNVYTNALDALDAAEKSAESCAKKVDATGRDVKAQESKRDRAEGRRIDCVDPKPLISRWVHVIGATGWSLFEVVVFSGRLADMGMNPDSALVIASAFVVVGAFCATLAGHSLAHLIAAKTKRHRQMRLQFWMPATVIAIAFVGLIVMTTPPAASVGGTGGQITALIQNVSLYGILIGFTGILSVMATDTSKERCIAKQQRNIAVKVINQKAPAHNINVNAAEEAATALEEAKVTAADARNGLRRAIGSGRMYEERAGIDLGLGLSSINLEGL
ncbi:MAG: hypothetical protein AAFX54_17525 [Pseudomonadota bacterium]